VRPPSPEGRNTPQTVPPAPRVPPEVEEVKKKEIKKKKTGDPYDDLQIGWKDGLPNDRTEDVTNEVAAVTARISSRYSAILRLNNGDAAATEQEMKRIEEEEQNTLLQEATFAPPPPGFEEDPDEQQTPPNPSQDRRQGAPTSDTRNQEEGGRKRGTPPAR
jgi:hypothetical protein